MVSLRLDVPESFYLQEERSGFTVTTQRKELWAVEMDLLVELDRVCKKYNLNYVLGAGSLLGAVRHKGFIPWDNDLDVYMLRKDYDKLRKHRREFSHPYFWQDGYSEKHICRTHARLRNSDTTGFSQREENSIANKGIFIDIFPIDGVSLDESINAKQETNNAIYRILINKFNQINQKDKAEAKREKLIDMCFRLFFMFISKNIIFQKYEKNLREFSNENSLMWGNRTLVFACPKSRRPYDDWLHITYVPFEFIEVPIPVNYDEILRQQYNDYMKLPKSLNGSVHGKLYVSASVGYRDYIKGETL